MMFFRVPPLWLGWLCRLLGKGEVEREARVWEGISPPGVFPRFWGLGVLVLLQRWRAGMGMSRLGESQRRRDTGAAGAGSSGMAYALSPMLPAGEGHLHLSTLGYPQPPSWQGVPRHTAPQPCPHVAPVGRFPRPGLWDAGCGRGRAPWAASQAPRSCCRGRSRSGSSRISLRAASHLLYYFSI